MKAPEHREKLEAEIWRILAGYTKDPSKSDVDHLLVWADIYAVAHSADLLIPVGES